MLRSTTQPNHPTVKTLSFESVLESSSLPASISKGEKNEKGKCIHEENTAGFSYIQHAVRLTHGCYEQSYDKS